MKELRSDLLNKNLKSLGKISPEMAREIRSSNIEAELVQTPSGEPSLKIGTTLLHSSREPVMEVMRQLDPLKKGDEDRVFFFSAPASVIRSGTLWDSIRLFVFGWSRFLV